MKNIYATLIILVLAFGLVGCADTADTEPLGEPAGDGEQAETVNETNDSNATPPLGTGYAGRGNIVETD